MTDNATEPSRTDPADRAATIAANVSDEEGAGVRHDVLTDAAIDAAAAVDALETAYVEFDCIADDLGLFPDDVRRALRAQQSDIADLAEWMDEFAEALRDERDAIEEVA